MPKYDRVTFFTHVRFMNTILNFLEVAELAAIQGGKSLQKWWGKLTQIREKSSCGDLVTEADHDSESEIISLIAKKFPEHRILSEESGFSGPENSDYIWAIDPLDGTTNYTHQMPMTAVSIALLHHNHPILGIVYNPFTNEFFKAYEGGGAFLNNKKIAVSKISTLNKSLLATGFAYDRRDTPDNNYLEFCYMTSCTQGVRRMGSAALDLAYLAAGRYDGFWERGLGIWDIAAGIILVREAGGLVTSYENESIELKSGRILATNGLIHQNLSDSLTTIRMKKDPIIFS